MNSAPSTNSSKRPQPHSPTQPPPYNPASLPSPEDIDPDIDESPAQASASAQKKNKASKPQKAPLPRQERDIPSLHANGELDPETSSAPKRPRKSNQHNSSGQKPDTPTQTQARSSTIVRHVKAVINVKQEDDSEEEEPAVGPSTNKSSAPIKKKEESVDQQRFLRTPRPKIIPVDADEDAEEGEDPILEEEHGQTKRQQQHPQERARLRQRSRINYREEEDELMLGSEVCLCHLAFVPVFADKRTQENHDEVFGARPVTPQEARTSKQVATGPPAKKRKLAAR